MSVDDSSLDNNRHKLSTKRAQFVMDKERHARRVFHCQIDFVHRFLELMDKALNNPIGGFVRWLRK
jgi:hypothetical protein